MEPAVLPTVNKAAMVTVALGRVLDTDLSRADLAKLVVPCRCLTGRDSQTSVLQWVPSLARGSETARISGPHSRGAGTGLG